MSSASIAAEWLQDKQQRAESVEMRDSIPQRFPMLLSPFWLPLLVLFGATPGRSFVQIDRNNFLVKFGFFRHVFPCHNVESATERNWSMLLGIGWRTDLLGLVGLIGSQKNVVEIKFRTRHRVNMIIPRLRCERLAISLQDPTAFLSSLDECRNNRRELKRW